MAFKRIILSTSDSSSNNNSTNDPSYEFQKIILDRKCK